MDTKGEVRAWESGKGAKLCWEWRAPAMGSSLPHRQALQWTR